MVPGGIRKSRWMSQIASTWYLSNLHILPNQLKNHASMQDNCLEFWVQKIWKNEFFIFLYFAQCRYHRNTKNYITPLNQIHKTFATLTFSIFHTYMWRGSTSGIRWGKIIVWKSTFYPQCRSSQDPGCWGPPRCQGKGMLLGMTSQLECTYFSAERKKKRVREEGG